MSRRPPRPLQPVPRRRLLAGALVLLALLVGVAALAGSLRHPPTLMPAFEPFDADDPRDEISCPPSAGDTPVAVNSNDLYDCPHVFDGRRVEFEGEVVGAVLSRADGAWVQLNDDAYAGDLGPLPAHREFRGGNAGVGVHLPPEVARQIDRVGSHRARGDVLTVTGTYHRSDPASGEVAVIRAHDGQIVRSGQPISHPPLRDRQVVGAVLAIAAAGLLIASRKMRHRSWR